MVPPLSFEELISKKKAVTTTVAIPLDPGLAEELHKAKEARDDAARTASIRDKDTDAQARLWQAEERVSQIEQKLRDDDAVAYFKLRSIGRAAFDALVTAHQPTSAQRAKAKSLGFSGEMAWNHETFPPALVAACLVEPEMTEDQARLLWQSEAWNAAETQALFDAALEVNGTHRTVELGKEFVKTRSSGPS